jgi:hypothetical protein
MRHLQRGPDPLRSEEAVEHLYRTWRADPRRVAWSADRYPDVPTEYVLRALAEAMWASAVPAIARWRTQPRRLRRARRRWLDALSLRPFPRWRCEAERHGDARPFTWESEKEMADREGRVPS